MTDPPTDPLPAPADGPQPQNRQARRPVLVGIALVVLVLVIGVVIVTGGDGDEGRAQRDPGAGTSEPSSGATPSTGSSETPSTTEPVIAGEPLALGELDEGAQGAPNCPRFTSCRTFTVTCPDLAEPGEGYLSVAEPTGNPRGFVLIFSGSGGTAWSIGTNPEKRLLDQLLAADFVVAQVSWAQPWLIAADGEEAGIARLACRPATVVEWVHRVLYEPLGVEPSEVGACGFCVAGNSGGASQALYPIAYYGLDGQVDAVVASGGPPHAAQRKGCLRNAGEEDYAYSRTTLPHLDGNYGFLTVPGPCETHDPGFADRWDADSIDIGAPDYVYDTTRIELILGSRDRVGLAHSQDFYERLQESGTPMLGYTVLDGVEHDVNEFEAGADAYYAAILGTS